MQAVKPCNPAHYAEGLKRFGIPPRSVQFIDSAGRQIYLQWSAERQLQSVTTVLELGFEPFGDVSRRLVGYVRGGQLARQKRINLLENQRVLGVRLHRLADRWWRSSASNRVDADAWTRILPGHSC